MSEPIIPPAVRSMWPALLTKVCANVVTGAALLLDHKYGLKLDADTQLVVAGLLFTGVNAGVHWLLTKVPALAGA